MAAKPGSREGAERAFDVFFKTQSAGAEAFINVMKAYYARTEVLETGLTDANVRLAELQTKALADADKKDEQLARLYQVVEELKRQRVSDERDTRERLDAVFTSLDQSRQLVTDEMALLKRSIAKFTQQRGQEVAAGNFRSHLEKMSHKGQTPCLSDFDEFDTLPPGNVGHNVSHNLSQDNVNVETQLSSYDKEQHLNREQKVTSNNEGGVVDQNDGAFTETEAINQGQWDAVDGPNTLIVSTVENSDKDDTMNNADDDSSIKNDSLFEDDMDENSHVGNDVDMQEEILPKERNHASQPGDHQKPQPASKSPSKKITTIDRHDRYLYQDAYVMYGKPNGLSLEEYILQQKAQNSQASTVPRKRKTPTPLFVRDSDSDIEVTAQRKVPKNQSQLLSWVGSRNGAKETSSTVSPAKATLTDLRQRFGAQSRKGSIAPKKGKAVKKA